jgi:hypothetical protein
MVSRGPVHQIQKLTQPKIKNTNTTGKNSVNQDIASEKYYKESLMLSMSVIGNE